MEKNEIYRRRRYPDGEVVIYTKESGRICGVRGKDAWDVAEVIVKILNMKGCELSK